jgi:hypothetical protein
LSQLFSAKWLQYFFSDPRVVRLSGHARLILGRRDIPTFQERFLLGGSGPLKVSLDQFFGSLVSHYNVLSVL